MKLTPPQRRVLDNLVCGKPAEFGLKGRSQHGGFVWTYAALRKKGLVDDNGITDLGKSAIKYNPEGK